MHPSIVNLLAEIGWLPTDVSKKPLEEISPLPSGYEGVFVRTRTRVDEKLLGPSPTVKFVARAGAGLDNIDIDFCKSHNIEVVHASEGNRDAVAEYTLGALLALLRNIPKADAEVRKSIWLREENRGEELMGKTVGIFGFGNMGQAFAKRLQGFSCKVLAYDKYKTHFGNTVIEECTLERIFSESEILSLHIPLTQETRNLVNTDFLQRFKKNIVLVNTSRGELASLQTLADGLRSGKLRGTVLDVLENEKINTFTPEQTKAFAYLSTQPRAVFTPHIAGWTYESHEKINHVLIEKLKALGFDNKVS